MSLADRLNAAEGRRPNGLPCSIATALAELEPDEHAALTRALDDPRFSSQVIYDALRAEGITVGLQTVGRHRAGKCRCAR